MKPVKIISITLLLFFTLVAHPGILHAQVPSGYSVGSWYQFKQAAITYTFDDNTGKQLSVAVPLFDKYGFKATFFPVPIWKPDWAGFKKAVENGHEVGSHSMTHPDFSKLSVNEQEWQLRQSKQMIDSMIGPNTCLTIAYPFCRTGDLNLVSKYYIAARICSGQIEPITPADMRLISSEICGSLWPLNSGKRLISEIDQTRNKKGWCVFLFHGIDNDGGYSAIASSAIDSTLDYLNGHRNEYWVSTFKDVAKYINERNCISIKEIRQNKKTIEVSVSDTLDNIIYNQPITLRRELPKGWNNVQVLQNNKTIPSEIITNENKRWIQFSIIPDTGIAEIIRSKEK